MKKILLIIFVILIVCKAKAQLSADSSDIFWRDTSFTDKFIIAPCDYCRLIYVEGWLWNGTAYDLKGRKILRGWLKKAKIIEIK